MSPYLSRPQRSYLDAVLDSAEQTAREMRAAPDMWVNFCEHPFRRGTGTYTDAAFFETLDQAAQDAAETPQYRFTLQIKNGVSRILHLKRHGQGILAEVDEDERLERQHVGGLVSYGHR